MNSQNFKKRGRPSKFQAVDELPSLEENETPEDVGEDEPREDETTDAEGGESGETTPEQAPTESTEEPASEEKAADEETPVADVGADVDVPVLTQRGFRAEVRKGNITDFGKEALQPTYEKVRALARFIGVSPEKIKIHSWHEKEDGESVLLSGDDAYRVLSKQDYNASTPNSYRIREDAPAAKNFFAYYLGKLTGDTITDGDKVVAAKKKALKN